MSVCVWVCVSDAIARGETLHISVAVLWLVCCSPVDLEEILPTEHKHVTKQLNGLISRQQSVTCTGSRNPGAVFQGNLPRGLAGEMPDKEQI